MLWAMKALQKAIKKAGGKPALAARLGVLPQHINNWLARGVPAARCLDIEGAADGVVTRYDLRPDVFGKPHQ
jgi:DNA-binding transcriptional regulator YdaS (Cro superfamily)